MYMQSEAHEEYPSKCAPPSCPSHQVIPMLPRILCEQLCSLNPNEVSDSDNEVDDSE